MRICVIGAGKTGRGFIARLLAEAGEAVQFIDKNQKLVDELNRERRYYVQFFGNVRPALSIGGYRASAWQDGVLDDAELIFVSVGGANLEDVGSELHKRLDTGRPYYVITCENASQPAAKLKKAIGLPNVWVSESTVFCTTIERNGLDINSENYPVLQFDADLLNGYTPNIPGIKPVRNFGNFLTRKLFTYNAASCIIAYLGWLRGYTDYAEAANDPEIQELLDRNYAVTNRVLCTEFGYDPAEQEEFARLSREKFCSRTIVDTVARNAREPHRKLGPAERIIGPLRLIGEYGEDTSVLEMTAAAMLLYDNDGEDAWRQVKASHTPEEILEQISGISRNSPIFGGIMGYYRSLKNNANSEIDGIIQKVKRNK